jgi:hypothetical protein
MVVWHGHDLLPEGHLWGDAKEIVDEEFSRIIQ